MCIGSHMLDWPAQARRFFRFVLLTAKGTDSTMRLVEAAGCCACLMVPSIPRDGISLIARSCVVRREAARRTVHERPTLRSTRGERRSARRANVRKAVPCPVCKQIGACKGAPSPPARHRPADVRAHKHVRQRNPHPYRYRTTRLQRSHLGSRHCSEACRSCCMRR